MGQNRCQDFNWNCGCKDKSRRLEILNSQFGSTYGQSNRIDSWPLPSFAGKSIKIHIKSDIFHDSWRWGDNRNNLKSGKRQKTNQRADRAQNDWRSTSISIQNRRFKISLVFVIFLMYFFYSEFRGILGMFMTKKRRGRWMWLYTLTMLSLLGIVLYRKRDYLKTYI